MKLLSYAKINLTLDILKKRDDGYHELKTIFQHIDLTDEIIIEEVKRPEIKISCSIKELESPDNICCKTADLLRNKYGIKKGVQISIKKTIPIGAGLSGGSSNAAAVLKGLNVLWDLNLTTEELADISRDIGMDVAFHLTGGTCLGEGRGEIIKKIKDFPEHFAVIVYPDINLNTGLMYRSLDYDLIGKKSGSENFMKEFDLKYLHNDFEYSVLKLYPQIAGLKKMLGENAMLSGSGSCVFKLAKEEAEAKKVFDEIKKTYKTAFLTKTVSMTL